MGLMGLLFNFALQCFHFLAWPLLAFGYPLCASIQAIEANSDSGTRKLITYWVCLSLLLLLDHAFCWLPYWPYVKLMIVGCLSIPCFDGSFYIYNRLVHPVLSVNPRADFNRFIKMLEIISEEESPLTVPKINANETELQGLQNLIPSKGTVERPKVEQKHILAEEVTEELSGNDQELRFMLPGGTGSCDHLCSLLACNRKPCRRRKRRAKESDKEKPEEKRQVSPEKSAQTSAETLDSKMLWTCVLCDVKCPEKSHLISHFKGQRHKKALASIKAKPDAEYCFKPWTCEICKMQVKNRNDLILHLESKRHLAACGNLKTETKLSVQDEVSSETNSNLMNKRLKEAKRS